MVNFPKGPAERGRLSGSDFEAPVVPTNPATYLKTELSFDVVTLSRDVDAGRFSVDDVSSAIRMRLPEISRQKDTWERLTVEEGEDRIRQSKPSSYDLIAAYALGKIGRKYAQERFATGQMGALEKAAASIFLGIRGDHEASEPLVLPDAQSAPAPSPPGSAGAAQASSKFGGKMPSPTNGPMATRLRAGGPGSEGSDR